jgi:hypothetical protein
MEEKETFSSNMGVKVLDLMTGGKEPRADQLH